MTRIASVSTAPGRPGRPPRERSEEIEMRIVAAAGDIFLAQGFETASMDAIAAQAGVSKATLYARFGSKAELFEAVIGRLGKAKIAELEALRLDAQGTLREALMQLARRILSVMIEPRVIAMERVIAGEAHQFPDLASRLHQVEGERVIAIVQRMIETLWHAHGRRAGQIDPMHARIFLAMVILAPLRQAMLDGAANDAVDEDFLSRSIDIFMAGTQEDADRG